MNNIIKYFKILLVILFIIFEEILWNKVGKPIYELIKSLRLMVKFKEWVGEFKHRYALLVIFITPFVLMEIMSLLSLKSFATGAIGMGISLYVVKLVLTVPVVIIFNSGKKQLVSFFPIRYGYGMIINLKRSSTFRNVKKFTKKVKQVVREFKQEYYKGVGIFDGLKEIYVKIKYH